MRVNTSLGRVRFCGQETMMHSNECFSLFREVQHEESWVSSFLEYDSLEHTRNGQCVKVQILCR